MSVPNSAISPERTYAALKLWRTCLRAHALDLLENKCLAEEDRITFTKELRLLLREAKPETIQKPSGLPNSVAEFARRLFREQFDLPKDIDSRIARSLLLVASSWEVLRTMRARVLSLAVAQPPKVLQKIEQHRLEIARLLGRQLIDPQLESILQIVLDTLNEAEAEIRKQCQKTETSESVALNSANWLLELDVPILAIAGAPFVQVLANFLTPGVGVQPYTSLQSCLKGVETALADTTTQQTAEPSPPLFLAVMNLFAAVTIIAPNVSPTGSDVSTQLFNCWLDYAPSEERKSWLLQAINLLVAALQSSAHVSGSGADAKRIALDALLRICGPNNVVPRLRFSEVNVPIPELDSLSLGDIQCSPVEVEHAAQQRFAIRCRLVDGRQADAREPLLTIFLPGSEGQRIGEAWSKLRKLNHPPLNQQFLDFCKGLVQGQKRIDHPSDWFLRRGIAAEQIGLSELIQRVQNGQLQWDVFRDFLECCRLQVFPPLHWPSGQPEIPSDLKDYPKSDVRYSQNLSDHKDSLTAVRFEFSRTEAAFVVIKAVPAEYRHAATTFDACVSSAEARDLLKQLLDQEKTPTTTTAIDILGKLAGIVLKDAGNDGSTAHQQMLAALREIGRRFDPVLAIHPEQFRFAQKLCTQDLHGKNLKWNYEYSLRECHSILRLEELVVTTAGTRPPTIRASASAGRETQNFAAAVAAAKNLPPKIDSATIQALLEMLPEKEATEHSVGHDTYLDLFRQLWPDDLSIEEVLQHEQDPSLNTVRDWFSSAVQQRSLFRVIPAHKGDYLGRWRKGETYRPVNDNYKATVVRCMLRPLLQRFNNTNVEMARFYVDED